MQRLGLVYFSAMYRETDLWIGVDAGSFSATLPEHIAKKIQALRQELDSYIEAQPDFFHSLVPIPPLPDAPELAKAMASAAAAGGVGPMAAVAGAFAETVGQYLCEEHGVRECIIENGGDIYLHTLRAARIAIYAGGSPLSGRLALRIKKAAMPLGVCTSSATVGPSLSFGCTDATTTLCRSAALADAYATTLGNLVRSAKDIDAALAAAQKLVGLEGCVIICGDKLGAWGKIELEPLILSKQKEE